MLQTEGLDKALPGIDDMDKGVQVYRQFYTEEEEKESGVFAIQIQVVL